MTRSLGKVVPGAGFVRATANFAVPTDGYSAHSVVFQQVPGNTGKIYIADKQAADKTQAAGINGIIAVLAIPTTNLLQSFTATIIGIPGGISVTDFWVGSDVNGEGVQIAAMKW